MKDEQERNLGVQPVAALLEAHGLKPKDLVVASSEQITFKMVTRACKGRRLTPNVQGKLLRAVNAAADAAYTLEDLFTY